MTTTRKKSRRPTKADPFAAIRLPRHINLLGPVEGGKSVLAGTISPDFPDSPLANTSKDPIILRGVAWLGADADATLSLRALGIEPEWEMDLDGLLNDPHDWKLAGYKRAPSLYEAFDTCITTLGDVSPRVLVMDTASRLLFTLRNQIRRRLEKANPGQKVPLDELYGEIGEAAHGLYDDMRKTASCTILCFHEALKKPRQDNKNTARQKEQEDKRKLITIGGGSIAKPTIKVPGQIAETLFKEAASYQFVLVIKEELDEHGHTVQTRTITCSPGARAETKSRAQHKLRGELPPNLYKALKRVG